MSKPFLSHVKGYLSKQSGVIFLVPVPRLLPVLGRVFSWERDRERDRDRQREGGEERERRSLLLICTIYKDTYLAIYIFCFISIPPKA